MRIYDGSPRQDFEEVFRSIGSYLDRRAMHDVLLTEVPDGFVVQGVVLVLNDGVSESMGQQVKETLTFLDDDIARFMDESLARRGSRITIPAVPPGYYEQALRVIGRYMDEQKPHDVFFFEQDGSFVVRLMMSTATGSRHVLYEFPREDIERMIADAPRNRQRVVAKPATTEKG
jgi:hypothetical protein